MRTKYKRIPFNLKLAKKITNKEIKGNIVTRSGLKSRIICFDRKEREDIFGHSKNIIALIENKGGDEAVLTFRNDGMYFLAEESDFDLHIEVPIYSNFEPQKWQPCLVRDSDEEPWSASVCVGKNTDGNVLFYGQGRQKFTWKQVLPLSKTTERLIGTRKSYEKLIQELKEIEYLITEKRIKQWT